MDVSASLAQLDAAATADGMAGQPWSPELVKFLALLVMGVALGLGTVLLWKKGSNSNDVLRVFGVVIIVCLSAMLLIVGFSNDQLTPIVGLFGAIAGYLFGKDTKAGAGKEK